MTRLELEEYTRYLESRPPSSPPLRETMIQRSFRLPARLLAAAEQMARQMNMERSEFLREALAEKLEANGVNWLEHKFVGED
jgi:hypothetical protein